MTSWTATLIGGLLGWSRTWSLGTHASVSRAGYLGRSWILIWDSWGRMRKQPFMQVCVCVRVCMCVYVQSSHSHWICFFSSEYQRRNDSKKKDVLPHLSPGASHTLPNPKEKKKKKKKSDSKHVRLRITSSYSFQEPERPDVSPKGRTSFKEDMVDGYVRPKVGGVFSGTGWEGVWSGTGWEGCDIYSFPS